MIHLRDGDSIDADVVDEDPATSIEPTTHYVRLHLGKDATVFLRPDEIDELDAVVQQARWSLRDAIGTVVVGALIMLGASCATDITDARQIEKDIEALNLCVEDGRCAGLGER